MYISVFGSVYGRIWRSAPLEGPPVEMTAYVGLPGTGGSLNTPTVFHVLIIHGPSVWRHQQSPSLDHFRVNGPVTTGGIHVMEKHVSQSCSN
jgi:hypothetical protein